MLEQYVQILLPICSAWLVGSLIGLERSYHGRPAGFRTHALVCTASALLMLATVHQAEWIGGMPSGAIATDPTRMAQGIMTGIGFLGAGVIFQEGLSVHGLTTAASIWMTASLGIMFGIGYYTPALITAAITLTVLGAFRWVERQIPALTVLKHSLRFARGQVMPEAEVRALMKTNGFVISKMGYTLSADGECFEYRMLIGTLRYKNVSKLADRLRNMPEVVEYSLSPMGS